MRILTLISSLRGGGAERAASTLSRLWSDCGHNVHVTTIATRETDFYKLDPRVTRSALDLESTSTTLPQALLNNVRRIVAIRRDMRLFAPDIVVAFMPSANVQASVAVLGLNVKLIGCERTHPPQVPMDRVRTFARAWFYGLLDATAALTTETADWLRLKTRSRRVIVIPNVVTMPLPETDPRVAPEICCAAGRAILLAVGRLSAEKGFAGLIEAFASIGKNHPTWDLVVAGEGPLREELERKIDQHGLRDRVFLPGRVGNIADWYRRASLFVLSSHVEGFPNALAEAMAHGVPAVSYDCDTGPRDIIRPGVDGILVPPGDTAKLASALNTLLGDDELRSRFAERAPEVVKRFSEEVVAKMWNDLFDKVRGR